MRLFMALFVVLLMCSHYGPVRAEVMMAVDEIRPGMVGVGRSVFRGAEVSEFRAEILGVWKNFGPKRDIILARLSGGPLDVTHNVIAGMSGSPVSVDGRLVGAVAYGWSFAKEAICGITPISEMMDVLSRDMSGGSSSSGGSGGPGAENGRRGGSSPSVVFRTDGNDGPAISEDGEGFGVSHIEDREGARAFLPPSFGAYGIEGARRSKDVRDGGGFLSWQSAVSSPGFALGGASLEPISTPLVMSGFSQAALRAVSPRLERLGFIPVQGGSGAEATVDDAVLTPGSAIGVQLLGGDLSITGIGTLTYRDGDRILAFGHPMLSAGNTDLPMTTAYIYDVMPSTALSFKLGSPGKPVGAIRQDRFPAVAGLIGPVPDTMPMLVEVGSGARKENYSFRVVRHPELGPVIAWSALLETITAAEKAGGDATIRIQSTIRVKGYPDVSQEKVYSGPDALLSTVSEGTAPFSMIAGNPFELSRIESVAFVVSIEEKRRSSRVEEVSVDRSVVHPGETVELRVLLRAFRGGMEEIRRTVEIPAGQPDGQLLLYVGAGGLSQRLEMSRVPGKFVPRDLPGLLELIGAEERNDRLIVALFSYEQGLTVAGRELPDLPASVLAVLGRSKTLGQTGPVNADLLWKDEIPVASVVEGSYAVRLTVVKAGR